MRLIDVSELINNINEFAECVKAGSEFTRGYVAAHKNFAKFLAEQPTIEQLRWIPVTERLPAESGYYLVVYRDKFNGSELVSIDFYTKCAAGEWWDNDFGRTAIY